MRTLGLPIIAGLSVPLIVACAGDAANTSEGDAGLSASGGVASSSAEPTGQGQDQGDADGDGDGDSVDGGGDAPDDDADGARDSSGDDGPVGDGGVKFDTSVIPDAPPPPCSNMGGKGELELSYIWVANSSEGTISKLDTETLVEEGRYRTRSDAGGSPSRTSVNLSSDVAVANRTGGITKVIANHDLCDPMTNGVPGLQTSTGSADVLAWGEDDCIAWHTSFSALYPSHNANRPAAWTAGVFNEGTCAYEDQQFWTSISNTGDPASMRVLRLDGETGIIDDDFAVPDINVGSFGAYGGAVDSENDFWFINYSAPRVLVEVDFETLDYQVWDVPAGVNSYGFTVDSQDRPWIGGFTNLSAVFDPMTQTFQTVPHSSYGLQEDANGIMWMAMPTGGLQGIDTTTLLGTQTIMLPASGSRGVSVDFYGYVWFVDQGTSAFKVDTVAETWDVYAGLNGPYTYSDMTGWGLSLTAGGAPAG